MELNNKKVLQVGLGILGGGVATARFLVEKGAILTITDLKNAEFLKESTEKLADLNDKIKFILGEHRERDFLENEIIIINPDVSIAGNKFLNLAEKAGKQIENELTLFYKFCPSRKMIAVTGTRGKTTTINWVAHLLKSKYPDIFIIGNSPEKPFLQEINNCNKNSFVVMETPSFQLEICERAEFAPHVAVITNLYCDHLNRHKTMENYALAKANIFKHQKKNDVLFLNKDDKWTEFFLKQKPKAEIIFFSKSDFVKDREKFVRKWGAHNLSNFIVASLVAKQCGLSDEKINWLTTSLPQIKFREEKVYDKNGLQIYNDTTATSPEALIASMQRFLSEMETTIFIIGGTNRELDFDKWGKMTKKIAKPENLILLAGSATEKMKEVLCWEKLPEFENLDECLHKALELTKTEQKAQIIFSPGAKSFEKFKNEFDRGEQFNLLVDKLLK